MERLIKVARAAPEAQTKLRAVAWELNAIAWTVKEERNNYEGAVVANRLSEVENWKVLLLEAGGDETEISDVPLMAAYLQLSALDWKYKSEPQGQACLAMNNGRCNWPRGKVIGGSSVLNYMLYLRGNKRDYDLWESLGNPGWGSQDVLYYFKKSEDNKNPYLAKTPYHATGGYLTVSEPPYHTPLVAAFVEAGKQLGYKNRDINGEIRANKEVILSAGSVNSPQLLMLSGVGPKAELEKHKIPVVQDLKVGHNLQDHIGLGGLAFLINKEDSITLDRVYSVGEKR
ncbi:unnamed protein product [Phaedon cochleariae]|uniref:Glucose-methanol-choline oxidoreductase N-terminal domain-containing protein n=1 Tax=Phaedon cochleariae TaxID=80249 RepID=A0A9N9SFI3_PHACE|nr:unnamed protein product [Phaedon cochleariae]